MKALICPVSDQRVNKNVVRITGFMTAALLAVFVFTGNVYLGLFIAGDYFIRVFADFNFSPLNRIAAFLNRLTGLKELRTDKAPKIFASRVGFLFALSAAVLCSLILQ